ncbi:3-carboxy-cis,cis-muconate cycloisomerase [Enterobacteriaceae bacterium 4M9]|nr:3-carboxy-cis,cis-muconate cycloisomerase [Enterobacteriaceae bacterium 4M9]
MGLYSSLFHDSTLADFFSERATLQGMLDFEAALARAQAHCGVIPQAAVAPIEAACRTECLDAAALAQAAASAGNLAIPLVKQLTAAVKAQDEQAARYVHWGATSQDAIDTGMVVQLRAALVQAEMLLVKLMQALAVQVQTHADSVMPGRTWLQHALPTTYGLKLAGTLDALLRWHERLQELTPRLLVLQFGGAAGTLASLKENGPQVSQALAQQLNLALADTPWHTQRDRLLEAAGWLAGVSTTLGKFAGDFALQMQTEVAEVAEPTAEGKGGSSTMPHKRNPVTCAAILSTVTRIPGLMATLYTGQLQQHERALGGWQAEWQTLPELATLAGGVLNNSLMLVEGMQVFTERMRQNLDITHGLIMAEAVTLALAEHIGKAEAHHRIEQLCHQALDGGKPLQTLLEQDEQVSRYLSGQQIARLLDPSSATGSASHFLRQVLVRFRNAL